MIKNIRLVNDIGFMHELLQDVVSSELACTRRIRRACIIVRYRFDCNGCHTV